MLKHNRPLIVRAISQPAHSVRTSPVSLVLDHMPPAAGLARSAFLLMVAINFINYLDRIIFVSVGPELKRAFFLSDSQVGLVSSAFLLIYTLSALPMGLLADRHSRTRIIAIGVGLWSLATWYTAISHTFVELLVGRAVLGIGEASYIPAGTALLVAYFAPEQRARILSRWGASTLLGTAIGFIAGGVIAQHIGWRWAFFFCGPPGLYLAWLAWRFPDRRSYDAMDLHSGSGIVATLTRRGTKQPLPVVLHQMGQQIRHVLHSNTIRMAIVIQALGLFVVTPAIIFIPIYLREHFHLTIQTTAFVTGGVLIPGGVLGTLLGGALADGLSKRFAGGRMGAVAIGFALACPFFILAFLATNLTTLLILAFFAITFMNMYNGPLNAVIQDVVPGTLRASASAVVMTFAHLLGDVGSPTIVGWLADGSGGGAAVRHVTHHAWRINIAQSLVICSGPALLLAALLAFMTIRIYVRETTGKHSTQPTQPEPDFTLPQTVTV